MPRPASRVALCQELGRLRSLIGKARRTLPQQPPPGPDAAAAYWLERAAWCLTQVEQMWDDPDPRSE